MRILEIRSLLRAIFLSLAMATSVAAQAGELRDAKRAKQLVEETDAYERQQRAQLAKELATKKREAAESLRRLVRKYKDQGKVREAREIRRALAKLEGRVGEPAKTNQEAKEVPASEVFQYEQNYFFKNDKISGKITFMKNGKVNMIYTSASITKNETWEFEIKADHVFIQNGGRLGSLYISEIPKTRKESIMIRFGGDLRHHVVTATVK